MLFFLKCKAYFLLVLTIIVYSVMFGWVDNAYLSSLIYESKLEPVGAFLSTILVMVVYLKWAEESLMKYPVYAATALTFVWCIFTYPSINISIVYVEAMLVATFLMFRQIKVSDGVYNARQLDNRRPFHILIALIVLAGFINVFYYRFMAEPLFQLNQDIFIFTSQTALAGVVIFYNLLVGIPSGKRKYIPVVFAASFVGIDVFRTAATGELYIASFPMFFMVIALAEAKILKRAEKPVALS